jgi:hypothetical protein
MAPGIHRIGGWVDSRAGLDAVEKRDILPLPGIELHNEQVEKISKFNHLRKTPSDINDVHDDVRITNLGNFFPLYIPKFIIPFTLQNPVL